MRSNSLIYIAGHSGLVGSALIRSLKKHGYTNLLLKSKAELNLENQAEVRDFFQSFRPEYVILAAAKVGGIFANNNSPAEFFYSNISIQCNVIHQSYLSGVKRLLFLGSSCIYPKKSKQPIKEESLMTGLLESTNRSYALAKISGIEMCWSYNRQYGTKYLCLMPTNLYGVNDNYDPYYSHVIPALIRKFHEAKFNNIPVVTLLGSGKAKREFLFSDDLAEACILAIKLNKNQFNDFISNEFPPIINVGSGDEITIIELAKLIKEVVMYKGDIVFDKTLDGVKSKLICSEKIKALNWKSKVKLKDGILIAYRDFLTHK